MATTTTNYELTKAGYNDIPDIETINDNMDTLDSSLVVGESNDDALATITKTTGWTNAEPITLGDKFQSAMTKISTMIKNLKWIYKFIGSTDISSIGDGTITNAISTLSSGKLNASDVKTSLTDTSTAHALSTASGKALNDAITTTNNNLRGYANLYQTDNGIAFGNDVELSEPASNFIYLFMEFNDLNKSAGNRALVVWPSSATSSYFTVPIYFGTTAGYVRLQTTGATIKLNTTSISGLRLYRATGIGRRMA